MAEIGPDNKAAAASSQSPHPGAGLGPWKVLVKKGVMIHHAPSDTADTNGLLGIGDTVIAVERKGHWIRHEKGWSCTLRGRNPQLAQVTDEDQELDGLIYKFSGLREESNFLLKRAKELQLARSQFAAAEANFSRVLAIMGSHQKADVESVESVQKYFMTQMKVQDQQKPLDDSLNTEVIESLEALRVDSMMVGKDLERFTVVQRDILRKQGKRDARVQEFGVKDDQAQYLQSQIEGRLSSYQALEHQLLNTISVLIGKKDAFLTDQLKAFNKTVASTMTESTKAIKQEQDLKELKLDNAVKEHQYIFHGHVDVNDLLEVQSPATNRTSSPAKSPHLPHPPKSPPPPEAKSNPSIPSIPLSAKPSAEAPNPLADHKDATEKVSAEKTEEIDETEAIEVKDDGGEAVKHSEAEENSAIDAMKDDDGKMNPVTEKEGGEVGDQGTQQMETL